MVVGQPREVLGVVGPRVIGSLIAPSALGELVQRYWPVGGPVRCKLVNHNVNDHYLVVDGPKEFMARVYGAARGSGAEVSFELVFARHAASRGVRVSAPVPRVDGTLFSTVVTPEGVRVLSLWAPTITRRTQPCRPVWPSWHASALRLGVADPKSLRAAQGTFCCARWLCESSLKPPLPHRSGLILAVAWMNSSWRTTAGRRARNPGNSSAAERFLNPPATWSCPAVPTVWTTVCAGAASN